MHFKKLLALLVSAALMLSLLAGCGNGESAVQALLKLLDGRYPNISIEIDHDLEADLRQAIRKAEAENAGDDAAVIRAALETALGSTITFRYLGDGQQGDTTFDLVFYAGSDPDKAAQAAYSQWNLVFANVPDDGKYDTSLAMVETENGVWMLVKATVDKAGTPDKPDKDDENGEDNGQQEPQEPAIPENGYEIVDDVYNVYNEEGLKAWAEAAADNPTLDCTLKDDITLTEVWTPIGTHAKPYTGIFDGDGHKISGLNATTSSQYSGLFGYIKGATVKNLALDAPTVSCSHSNGYAGGVAAYMQDSTIENCQVSDGSISCTDNESTAGGIVGYVHIFDLQADENVVKNCQVSGVTISAKYSGGVAGTTSDGNSRIENCEVSGSIITSQVSDKSYNGNAGGIVGSQGQSTTQNCFAHGNIILATGPSGRAGGVVGSLSGNSTTLCITACGSTGNTIKATATQDGSAAGGVVGYTNGGTVTACFSADDTITGPEGDPRAGGVVGACSNAQGNSVEDCYWSNNLNDDVGYKGTGVLDNHLVDGKTVTWSTVADAMGDYWQDNGPDRCPALKDQ